MRFRRRRAAILPRPEWRRDHDRPPEPPLAGGTWTRGEGEPRRVGGGGRGRRGLALAAAGLEVVLLAWLLAGSAFPVRQVSVRGTGRLDGDQVTRAAGLAPGTGIFALDPAAAQSRLAGSAWIRSASVRAQLPGTVVVAVDEWVPIASYHTPTGDRWYLSDQGVVLGPVNQPEPIMLDIQGPAGAEPRPGQRPVDPRLLAAMVNIARGTPGALGQTVRAFTIDGCGNLTMRTGRGWRVEFGRVLTPEEFAALPAKLAAVRSLTPVVDYSSPDLDYVNVMNASQPAVHMKPKPTPTPAAGASPAPPPAPAPVAPGAAACR